MLIYPAIDLIDGACVRLEKGRFDAVTLYDTDPFARLKTFAAAGTRWVHIVDLDGSKAGEPRQHELIKRLAQSVPVKIQTGGGVRSREDVKQLLDAGAASVVVGSAAVKSPDAVRSWLWDFGPDHLTLALDVLPTEDGGFEVTTHGWTTGSGIRLEDALALYPAGSLKKILVTDVSRDGMLTGPNQDLIQRLVTLRPELEVQASGGVAQLSDLTTLKANGAGGVIIGKALYEGRFTLPEALSC